jgi:hypothetical protein
MYYYLSMLKQKIAYIAALAFLFLPTTLATPTFARQDESIVVFIFIVPLLLLYVSGRKEWYALIASLGLWVKMHSIFLLPPFLLKVRKQDLLKQLGIITVTSLVITVPFLILAFNEFTWYLKFYLFGEGEELQGISMWRIMEASNIGIPNIILIGILGITLFGIYIMYHKKSLWKCVLLSLLAYFIIYPKIHYEYFLVLFAVAIPYMAEKKRFILLLFMVSILTSVTLLIEQRYLDWKTTEYAYWVFVGTAGMCMVVVNGILIFLFHKVMKNTFWIDAINIQNNSPIDDKREYIN